MLALFFYIQTSTAQDKALADAFAQSYTQEAATKYDAGISELMKVYNANSYEINLRLGWLNFQSGKYKESVSYYQKAIALMPASIEPIFAIVNPYSKLENWVEVEKSFYSILKLDSKNSIANYRLGLIYYYRKDYVTALKFLNVSLNLYPFDYNNMLMTAWTNYFLGNKNEARVLFNKVLLYSPNDSSALEGLSLIK